MSKSLIIVESPAKARTISKILGKDYVVKATVGHILDLPQDQLGVDLKDGFKPIYQRIQGKSKIITELKKAAADTGHILLATDPDREGEAIAYHIAKVISKSDQSTSRVMFHEITPAAVNRAIDNPGQIDQNRVDAQQARRVLDRLVGYLVSPILWKTVSKGLSAGRVQSVALRMVCEREAEIRLFKPEEYWTIEAELLPLSRELFRAQAVSYKGKKLKIPDKSAAEGHLEILKSAEYYLKDRKKKQVKRSPQPPFTTSTMQQEAAKRLHFGGKRTMSIAQSLYEGVEIGEKGLTGLITYMRTDSVRVSPEAVSSVRDYIVDTYGIEYLPGKPRVYKSKGRAQEAHEAIRPTNISLEPKNIKKYLKPEQFRLYKLIYSRFVASQMKDAVFNQTTLEIAAGDYLFRVTDSVPIFRGFMQALDDREETDSEDKGERRGSKAKIPEKISVGERLELKGLFPEQHFTEPPLRFNESSLIKALDEQGIGRPSTYATIISTLFDRNYIIREEKRFHPTELGETVNNILISNFPDIFSIDFTAKMENRLDDIEAGDMKWNRVVEDFYLPFNSSLESIERRKDEIKRSLQEKTGEKCEKCGSDMVIRWGKNGRFIACSNFPQCRNTKPLGEEKKPQQATDKKCPKCGGVLVIKNGRFGQFLGCANYPKCRHIEPLDIGVNCPREDCGGRIVERRSRKGKVFYGCTKYPECDYVSWNRPVERECPECGSPVMEVMNRKDGEVLKCPKCKHEVK